MPRHTFWASIRNVWPKCSFPYKSNIARIPSDTRDERQFNIKAQCSVLPYNSRTDLKCVATTEPPLCQPISNPVHDRSIPTIPRNPHTTKREEPHIFYITHAFLQCTLLAKEFQNRASRKCIYPSIRVQFVEPFGLKGRLVDWPILGVATRCQLGMCANDT